MASYGGTTNTIQADQVRSLIAEVKALTVDRLKKVLRQENLQLSGLKQDLQTRLITHIDACSRNQDFDRINRIRTSVRSAHIGFNGSPYPSPYSNYTPASSASPQFNSPTPRLPPPLGMPAYTPNRVAFKNSPFYTIQRALSTVHELKPREQTRDTARVSVILDDGVVNALQTDSSLRVMVFCAADNFDSFSKPVDIAFPTHADLKCNSDEVKANLKGLKNKPGSTRPADLTDKLRKKANYPNTVELMYALTNKGGSKQKYYMVINLVRRKAINELVTELKHGKYRSKERVVRDMQTNASDDDIVATSSNMSLRDPVQMTRIETPCRGSNCKHNECFDAAVYLALQEQAPTWTCPICNKPAHWDNLVFDQFVQDILDNTGRDALQVTVEPDGRWHLLETEKDTDDEDDGESPIKRKRGPSSDDEIIEITDFPRPTARPSNPFTPGLTRTPSSSGAREHAATPSSQSNKRQRIDVDLTISDDEDDTDQGPVSRVKRPSFTATQISDSVNRLPMQGSNMRGQNHVILPPPNPISFTLPPPRPSSSFGMGGNYFR